MSEHWRQSVNDRKTDAMIAVLADAIRAQPADILVVGYGTYLLRIAESDPRMLYSMAG